MQIIKLRKVGNSMAVTLPPSIIESLHLHENDEIAIEVSGDCIMLTRATGDVQDAWAAYQKLNHVIANEHQD